MNFKVERGVVPQTLLIRNTRKCNNHPIHPRRMDYRLANFTVPWRLLANFYGREL